MPQVRSELLLWVFKFRRILRVFKLLKFIDGARVLEQALRGSARTIGVFLFFVFLLQVVLGYSESVVQFVATVKDSGADDLYFQCF